MLAQCRTLYSGTIILKPISKMHLYSCTRPTAYFVSLDLMESDGKLIYDCHSFLHS